MRNSVNTRLYNGKELQVGTGYLDYGARMFMPEIGRWGVTDPNAEKYPSWTPYNYAFNNSLKYIDPNGKDGILVIKGNTLKIRSNIYLYGSGATKATAVQMQQDIMAKWNKGFSVKDAGGNSYNVKFDVKVGLYRGKEKVSPFVIPESWNPKNRDNFIEVGATLGEIGRSFVTGGDEGEWRGVGRNGMSLSQDNPAPHEFGHILGLDDRYDDKNGPNKGWGNNIMGDSQKGNVEQRNINSIVSDAMKAYGDWSKDKNNTGKPFRYEINVDRLNKEKQ